MRREGRTDRERGKKKAMAVEKKEREKKACPKPSLRPGRWLSEGMDYVTVIKGGWQHK